MKRWKWGAGAWIIWMAAMFIIGGMARSNGELGLYTTVGYFGVLVMVLGIGYFAKQRVLLLLLLLYGCMITVLSIYNFFAMIDVVLQSISRFNVLTPWIISPFAGMYHICEMLTDHLPEEMFWAGSAVGGILLMLIAIVAFVPVCTRIANEKELQDKESHRLAEQTARYAKASAKPAASASTAAKKEENAFVSTSDRKKP